MKFINLLILEFINTKRICYPESSIVNHRENEFISFFVFMILKLNIFKLYLCKQFFLKSIKDWQAPFVSETHNALSKNI